MTTLENFTTPRCYWPTGNGGTCGLSPDVHRVLPHDFAPEPCSHPNHIPDPDYPRHATGFRVCPDCGLCLVQCHYCPTVYPDVRGFGSPGFCEQMDGCEKCCDAKPGPLTAEDTVAVILAACAAVANGYRWKTVRMLPPEQRLAWVRREFSNGGSYGGRLSFDGFRARETKGRGLWAQVRHHAGIVTWSQILNFIEAREVRAAVCLDCGTVTESLGPIDRCDSNPWHIGPLVPDPQYDGWSSYLFQPAPQGALFAKPTPQPATGTAAQLSLF